MEYKARYLYSELSRLLQARKNCAIKSANDTNADDWFNRHTETIERLVKNHLPSGSGFDSGTTLDLDASHAEKLVFHTSFHHMHESGMYDGWTEHTVTVTPSLGFDYHLRISGRNRNDIKEYIGDSFRFALDTDVTYDLYVLGDVPDVCKRYEIKTRWLDSCRIQYYVGTEGQADYVTFDTLESARRYAGEQAYNAFMSR